MAGATTNQLLAAIAGGIRTYDLARPYVPGMPQSPNHPVYTHVMPTRHGDRVRADGSSGANDLLILGTHVGTHIDAPAHSSYRGELHSGVDAELAQRGGRFDELGIDSVAPIVTRGILLDVPATTGRESCEPAHEITPDELDAALSATGVEPRPGDVLLVRSGWGRWWDDATAYVGWETGVPGVGHDGARWLAAHRPAAVGADTIAFEHLTAGRGHALLPAHRVLLVDAGIPIMETMALDALAADGIAEFLFVASPLNIVGATGSPIRPLAVVDDGH